MTRTSPSDEEEVGPIVFRPASTMPSPAEAVDHITFPPEPPALHAEPLAERQPPPSPPKATVPGLVLGLVAGVASGAAVGLFALHRLDQREGRPPAQPSPSRVLAQALTTRPGPAVIPAPPAPAPSVGPIGAPPPKPRTSDGFDLDQLARAIATATPPSSGDAASVAPPQPPPVIEAPPPQPARRTGPEPAPAITAPPVIIAQPAPPPPAKAAPTNPAPAPPRFDPDLARAEQRLSLAYDRAMASAPDRAALHAEQDRWLQQRSRIADKAALLDFYQARTAALLEQDRIERKKGGIARLLRD